MPDFLLELGTEEIPARMIHAAAEELRTRVGKLLATERLGTPRLQSFSTPRRITLLALGIAVAQADVEEHVTGPALKVAYKDGVPTAAAEAFAKKVGVPVAKLEKATTPKGEYLAATVKRTGREAADILSESLPKEIASLYWPKNMYWRAGKPERFVRPVRWLVALLDDKVVPLQFGGVTSQNESRGHRVLSRGEIAIKAPAQYSAALEKASVIVDPEERRRRIVAGLESAAKAKRLRLRTDASLLDTVVNLTEFPSVLLGGFDPEYLALPEEVLVTVMRDHQKYFAVEDANGKLAPHFLAVLNTDGDPDGLIRHGNERVLRARFNDAHFFWQTDQKTPLRERITMLRSVTFQKDLGSYYEKSQRVAKLGSELAHQLSAGAKMVNARVVRDAATFAKADLTTELVKEFTELQGIVGGLYAKAQGLGDDIATGIYDQYKPESMDDAVPRTAEAAVVAIADKADTIAGMFAIGLVPSGSKDPFALRRAANGIVKTIAEHKLALSLAPIMSATLDGYTGSEAQKKFRKTEDTKTALAAFFRERLEFYLRDVRGFAYDVVNAVLAVNADDVTDAIARAEAVSKVRSTPDFEPISVAFKRMKNILRQARDAGKMPAGGAGHAQMEPAEQELLDQSREVANRVRQLKAEHKYEQALVQISRLRPAVDKFFDKIMVMVDDESLRGMRLALLDRLVNEFSTIADFSEIVTESKA